MGQYDAAWAKVEAEWYMTAAHAEKIQTNNATNNSYATFAVRFYNASSAIGFPNVKNLPTSGTLVLQLARGSLATGHWPALALYSPGQDGARGVALAKCNISSSNPPSTRSTCQFKLPPDGRASQRRDLLFVLEGPAGAAGGTQVELDSWSIEAPTSL
eukprot:SAG31_NODE_4646_length_3072_cov_4.380760_2_plen_158_part_00